MRGEPLPCIKNKNMSARTIIGIDLGGTNVRAGIAHGRKIEAIRSARINSNGTVAEVLHELYLVTDRLMNDSVKAIGIGVPGLVDIQEGVVYDVVNIPSWIQVPLKKLMETRYRVPVLINNDANCFVLGEHCFGKGQDYDSLIGLNIGTGLGAGIMIANKLYAGANCGAGEFGMVDYLDKNFEFYASGQFFQNAYQIDGESAFDSAMEGKAEAIKMFKEFGTHLGNAIKMILYTFDMKLIVLGGSVRHAWPFFSETMWKSIRTMVFTRSVEQLRIVVSELENGGILGATALHYNE